MFNGFWEVRQIWAVHLMFYVFVKVFQELVKLLSEIVKELEETFMEGLDVRRFDNQCCFEQFFYASLLCGCVWCLRRIKLILVLEDESNRLLVQDVSSKDIVVVDAI